MLNIQYLLEFIAATQRFMHEVKCIEGKTNKKGKHLFQIWQPGLGYISTGELFIRCSQFFRPDRGFTQAPHRRRVFPRRAHSWKNVDVELPIVSAQSRTRFRRTEGGMKKVSLLV